MKSTFSPLFVFAMLIYSSASSQVPGLRWTKQIGQTNNDQSTGIATDASGNFYSSGFYSGTTDFDPGPGVFNLPGTGGYLLKLDPNGALVWAAGPFGAVCNSLAVDAAGNVIGTGSYSSPGDFDPGPATFNLNVAGATDIFIVKLGAAGNFIWAKGVGAADADEGRGIAADNTNSIYVTGTFKQIVDFDPSGSSFNLASMAASTSDIFMLKLNSNGDFVWAKNFGGTGNDFLSSIILDASANMYTSGRFSGSADFDPAGAVVTLTSSGGEDVFITKFDSAGTLLIAKSIGGTGNDIAHGLAIDASRNIYATGGFQGTCDFDPGPSSYILSTPNAQSDVFVLRLDPTGNFMLALQFGSTGSDEGRCITLDASGNFYAGGVYSSTVDFDHGAGSYNLTSFGALDMFFSKFDNAGNLVWVKGMGGAQSDYPAGMVLNNTGDLLIDGYFFSPSIDFDGLQINNVNGSGASSDLYFCRMDLNCPPPATTITAGGPTTFCSGGSVTLSAVSAPQVAYQWKQGGVNIAGATNSSYATSSSGLYTCLLTNNCFGTTSNNILVTVISAPPAAITASGPTTFCSGTPTTLTANTGAGLSHQWRVNSSPISGATNSSYTPSVNGNYDCVVSNSCFNTTSNQISITILQSPPSQISPGGPVTFCSGGSVQLNASTSSGLTYQWTQNGNGIPGATNSSYVANASGTYRCQISNISCSVLSNSIIVTVNTTPVAVISSSSTTTNCNVSAAILSANTNPSYSYQWRLNGNPLVGATSSTYTAIYSGPYTCTVTNNCGSALSNSITITATGTPPTASISATSPTTVCNPGTVSFSAMTNTGWSFQWRNNGVSINGATNSTYVLNTTVSCAISCRVTNACGSVTSNAINVTVQNPPSPVLTFGNTNVCSGSSVSISVTTGTGQTYQWRKNGAVIPGFTSSTYQATSTGLYDAVVTNGCGSFPSTNQANVVVTTAPPATITANGPTSFCPGGSVLLSANTGAGLSYAWRQNGGAIPGETNSTYLVTAWGLYDCVVSNSCGSSNSNQINITVSNPPTATIVAGGPTTFCQGGSVTINVTPGNGWSYQWRQNGNAITGATSTSYVAIASGGYTCTVSNNCGNVTSGAVNVVVNTVPVAGAISGPNSNVCNSIKTYTIASVAGATSYVWTVPSGASISSGQGTINLMVSFSSSYGGGSITVTASNSCGTGPTSSLTVAGAPLMPGNITGPVSVCQHQNNVTYSIAAVSGATSYTWTVPPGAQIKSGQGTTVIKVRFGTSAGNITVTANNACGSGPARSLAIAMPCRDGEEIPAGTFEAKVYPNPSSDRFTLEVNSSHSESASIRIFDLSGRILEIQESVPMRKEFYAGENLPSGIYIAEIISGNQKKVVKLIKQ